MWSRELLWVWKLNCNVPKWIYFTSVLRTNCFVFLMSCPGKNFEFCLCIISDYKPPILNHRWFWSPGGDHWKTFLEIFLVITTWEMLLAFRERERLEMMLNILQFIHTVVNSKHRIIWPKMSILTRLRDSTNSHRLVIRNNGKENK